MHKCFKVLMIRLVQVLVRFEKATLSYIKCTHCIIIHCDVAVGSYTLVTSICDVSGGMNQSHYTKQVTRTFDVNYVT